MEGVCVGLRGCVRVTQRHTALALSFCVGFPWLPPLTTNLEAQTVVDSLEVRNAERVSWMI